MLWNLKGVNTNSCVTIRGTVFLSQETLLQTPIVNEVLVDYHNIMPLWETRIVPLLGPGIRLDVYDPKVWNGEDIDADIVGELLGRFGSRLMVVYNQTWRTFHQEHFNRRIHRELRPANGLFSFCQPAAVGQCGLQFSTWVTYCARLTAELTHARVIRTILMMNAWVADFYIPEVN